MFFGKANKAIIELYKGLQYYTDQENGIITTYDCPRSDGLSDVTSRALTTARNAYH